MKVGNLNSDQRWLISLRITGLRKLLEASLEFLVSHEISIGPSGSLAFRLTHGISVGEMWDCGLIVLRKLNEPPEQLLNYIQKESLDQDQLAMWTELIALSRRSMESQELDHLRIVVSDLWKKLPPNTVCWSHEPRRKGLLRVVEEFSEVSWMQPDYKPAGKMIEDQFVPQTAPSPVKRRPGRPDITPEQIAARREIVSDAREIHLRTGKPYTEIAKDLDMPYRRLIQWKHDIRTSEP